MLRDVIKRTQKHVCTESAIWTDLSFNLILLHCVTGFFFSGIPTSLITVVTYGLLRHPASHLVKEALINQEYKVAIVDESHYMKNRKSAGTKYLVPLLKNSHRKLLLTGTPALSRPEEVRRGTSQHVLAL